MPKRERTISDTVREIMAALPEVEEFESHGLPTFRVRGRKVFATYTINHHGDGRVALNLMAPPGAQAAFVKMRPRVYFVPPYVGPSGWLGIELDKGLGWSTVGEHVREAYAMVAPAELVRSLKKDFRVRPPTRKFRPEEIDRFQSKSARAVLKKLDAILRGCRKPSAARGSARRRGERAQKRSSPPTTTRAGSSSRSGSAPRQKELVKDKRFAISQYTGHNGWIDLDVEEPHDWAEIGALALESYRHFALKRMLKEL